MIEVTRLDGSICYINPLHIEFAEQRPDLTLSMLSGRKLVIKESIMDLQKRLTKYFASIPALSRQIDVSAQTPRNSQSVVDKQKLGEN